MLAVAAVKIRCDLLRAKTSVSPVPAGWLRKAAAGCTQSKVSGVDGCLRTALVEVFNSTKITHPSAQMSEKDC